MRYSTAKHVIPPQNTSFWVFCSAKSDLCKCQVWLEIAQMWYSTSKCVFLCVSLWKISFVQVPSLTLSWTNAITHRRTRLFECFTIQIRFLQIVNSDFKFHTYNIPQQNTSFWVCCNGKPDFSKCQLWLEIAQMRYPTAKHVFLCVLSWKICFVQVPTLTLNCTNLVIHRRTRLFECFIVGNPISATVNFDFKLHKCNIPPQNTSYQVFCGGKSDLCKCQPWLEIAEMQYFASKHVFLCVLQWKISFM